MEKHYKTLGLENGASQEDIKNAYECLSNELNPANNDNQEFFKEEYDKVQEAYKALNQTSILKNSESSSGSFSSKKLEDSSPSTKDPGSFTVTISPEKIEELKNKVTEHNSDHSGKHKGVGGWLLLLCFALTIGSPLSSLYNLIDSYKETYPYFDLFPSLQNLLWIDSFLSIFLMVFSIRAGIALWSVKPGAVKIAKNYFFIYLGYCYFPSFYCWIDT